MSRKHAKIVPSFWTGETARKFLHGNTNLQVVAMYLVSGPHAHMTGLYYLPMAYLCHDIGMEQLDAQEAMRALHDHGFVIWLEDEEWVFVVEQSCHQIGETLKPTDNRVKYICERLSVSPGALVAAFFERYSEFYDIDATPFEGDITEGKKPLLSQKQKQKQSQKQNQKQKTEAEPEAKAEPPGVAGFSLNKSTEGAGLSTWSGGPIPSMLDLELAISTWGWWPNSRWRTAERKRAYGILEAGPIAETTWEEAKEAVLEKGPEQKWKFAFFLGCVERIRKQAAKEGQQGNAPAVASVPDIEVVDGVEYRGGYKVFKPAKETE